MSEKGIEIYIGATSIRTALGNKAATFTAMNQGVSGLKMSSKYGMYAGEIDIETAEGLSRFESLVVNELDEILKQTDIQLNNPDTLLILATTKGSIELLADGKQLERVLLGSSAELLEKKYNCANKPIVISNACISGLSALITARDLLLSQKYRNAIIVGCDVLSEFITTGFTSFKSISSKPCRPYDAARDGLTLGEACGIITLTTNKRFASKPFVKLCGGAITNDANHISGPSRTGDGLFYAIKQAMNQANTMIEDIGFVSTHGTATAYNDEMESKAIALAELTKKPLNSLKGYIGHTLGASGVVETVICIEELRQNQIVGTKGFATTGTPVVLCVDSKSQTYQQPCCIKTASGFGGCNAAIVLKMNDNEFSAKQKTRRKKRTVAEYCLPKSELTFAVFIRQEFKKLGKTDMKFYKMSDLCKALYISVERLLAQEDLCEIAPQKRAIVLSNRSSSLDSDMEHQKIVNQHLAEGASPAVFVYTLPNVAAGEMCIKHKIMGNNTFYVENSESGFARLYAEQLIETDQADAVIYGWCEYLQGQYKVDIKLIKK